MKLKSKDEQLLEEAYERIFKAKEQISEESIYDEEPEDVQAFQTPEEVYQAIDVLEGSTVHVMDPETKDVYKAEIDYDSAGLSLYWQQEGEDYAIDMSVKDSHDYPYSFVDNNKGRWIELGWAPGEKVLVRAKPYKISTAAFEYDRD